MIYVDNVTNKEYIRTMIMFLLEKANYYKNNNADLYKSYISLAYDYVIKLEKVSDVND